MLFLQQIHCVILINASLLEWVCFCFSKIWDGGFGYKRGGWLSTHIHSEARRGLVVSSLGSHCAVVEEELLSTIRPTAFISGSGDASPTTGPNGCPDVGLPILCSVLSIPPNSRPSKSQLTSGTLNIRSQSFKISDLNFQLEKLGKRKENQTKSAEGNHKDKDGNSCYGKQIQKIEMSKTRLWHFCFSENIIQIISTEQNYLRKTENKTWMTETRNGRGIIPEVNNWNSEGMF